MMTHLIAAVFYFAVEGKGNFVKKDEKIGCVVEWLLYREYDLANDKEIIKGGVI